MDRTGNTIMGSKDSAYTRARVLRLIYALCLAGATYNHAAAIYRHGWLWDYGGYPRVSTTFWTALGVLDPLAIVLLFVRPRWGVAMTVAIIVADVAHNLVIAHLYFPPLLRALTTVPSLAMQVAFMIFVLFTCRMAALVRPRRAT
ncbi:hypothetical protein [Sphingomonas adhaesiva]|uniref:hypothetical protein n=1 Tax=Sphingomonas adhaesiva TaxID=28212 RepID=UPI002FFCF032